MSRKILFLPFVIATFLVAQDDVSEDIKEDAKKIEKKVSTSSGNTQTGCGLGNAVFSAPNSAVIYALQATTNNTFGLQTFGISSGTLGCQKTRFVMDTRTQEFVASNMDALSKDISRGSGESLETLLELLAIQDREEFKIRLQENYNKIYTSQQIQMNEVLDNISVL